MRFQWLTNNPGDGNTPVTLACLFDLVRFVVAALDLEEWPEESRVDGDDVTWNEFVALAKEITGMYIHRFILNVHV